MGVRGSTVEALAAFSAIIALLALTGGVAAGGGPPAGSTATQADEAVNVTGRIVDAESGQGIDTGRVVLANRSADVRFAAETNATGAFEIAVPANDTYAVTFGDGGPEERFPRNGIPDVYELAEVTPSADVDVGEVTVPAGTSSTSASSTGTATRYPARSSASGRPGARTRTAPPRDSGRARTGSLASTTARTPASRWPGRSRLR